MTMKQIYDPNQPLDNFEEKLKAAEAMVLHKGTAQLSQNGTVASKVPSAAFGSKAAAASPLARMAAPALMAGAVVAAMKGAVPVAKFMATAAEAVSNFSATAAEPASTSSAKTAFGRARGTRRTGFRTISVSNSGAQANQRVSIMAPSRRSSMFRRKAGLFDNARKPVNVPVAFMAPADPETAAALRLRRLENERALASHNAVAPERLDEQVARMGLQRPAVMPSYLKYRLTLS